MVNLFIIADDLTGALDTGIQFAHCSLKTKIITNIEFSKSLFTESDIEVIVVDTESRHLSPAKSYRIIYELAKLATEAGVKYLYKKTDSGLRGNIGSELAAALAASKANFLAFIPALPFMNRVTLHGQQYIDGVPVHKSVFGRDPYNPVKSSDVKDLFNEISYPTVLYEKGSNYRSDFQEPTIGIFDAQTNNDLKYIGDYLKHTDQLKVIAGSTGFAAVLPELMGVNDIATEIPKLKGTLLVICGSMNPITREQIEYGEAMGFTRIVLSSEQLFEDDFFTSDQGEQWLRNLHEMLSRQRVVMIDTGISQPDIAIQYMQVNNIDMEEARTKISCALGRLLARFYESKRAFDTTTMIIGGDTLRGYIEIVDSNEINLICEIALGTVLSQVNVYGSYAQIISKSGGFGTKELIVEIANKIIGDEITADNGT